MSVPGRKRFRHKRPRNHPIRHAGPSLFFPYNNLSVGSLLARVTFKYARFQPFPTTHSPSLPAKALTLYALILSGRSRIFFEDICINMIYSFLRDVIQQTKRNILLRPSHRLI